MSLSTATANVPASATSEQITFLLMAMKPRLPVEIVIDILERTVLSLDNLENSIRSQDYAKALKICRRNPRGLRAKVLDLYIRNRFCADFMLGMFVVMTQLPETFEVESYISAMHTFVNCAGSTDVKLTMLTKLLGPERLNRISRVDSPASRFVLDKLRRACRWCRGSEVKVVGISAPTVILHEISDEWLFS